MKYSSVLHFELKSRLRSGVNKVKGSKGNCSTYIGPFLISFCLVVYPLQTKKVFYLNSGVMAYLNGLASKTK